MRSWKTRPIPEWVLPQNREAMETEGFSINSLASYCALSSSKVEACLRGGSTNQKKYREIAIAMGITCDRLRLLIKENSFKSLFAEATLANGGSSQFAEVLDVTDQFVRNISKGIYDAEIFDDMFLVSKALKLPIHRIMDTTN